MNSALFPLAGRFAPQLPWDVQEEDERRFQRIVRVAFAGLLAASVVLPWLPLEERPTPPLEPQTMTLASVSLEPRVLPKPVSEPVPESKPVVEPEPPPTVETRKQTTPPPRTARQPVVEEPPPQPVDTLQQARDRAAASGLLAFKDDLEAMRDSVDVNTLNKTRTRRGQASAATVSRNLVTSDVPARSGGISTADLSTDTGGAAVSRRETVAVTSGLSGSGSGKGKPAVSGPTQGTLAGGRSDEEIRRVMDSNKGGIFAIYNRALRADPLLQGRLVFEMVIAPDGRVTAVELLSSELADTALAKKILARVRLIRFKPAAVRQTRVNYSFDFLPHY